MNVDRAALQAAFNGRTWRLSSEALFEATGLVVSVMDRTACSVIHSLAHCTHCQLTAPTSPAAPGACFDDPPRIDTKVATRTVCRAGLPCDIAPLHVDEVHMANLFVGGYVSSTRDRKRLFERLLASSVPEAQARLAVREMPVMTRREIDGLVRLMAAGATSILESAVHSRQAAVKTRELEVIVGAGREFIERRGMGPDLLEAVLERGMDIISADSGSLMMVRSGTDLLEVVAPRGGALRNAAGEMVRIGEGIAGRVAESGRSVLITGASDPVLEYSVHPGRGITTSVSVPLMHSGVVLGVINLNSSDPDHVLTGEDLLLVEQYASFAASVIRNARLHETTERRMYELMQLSGIASTLGVSADIDEVLSLTSSLLEKAFDFEVAGIVLNSWGRDHATIVLGRDLSSIEADEVLAEAAGRDLLADPFESTRLVTHRGSLVDEVECRDGWNVMSSEMVVRDSVVGFAFIASCAEGAFDADDRRLLDGLAHHTALALERATLFQRARDDLTRTITALSATLDATEHASPGHADRVMDYAMLIGEEMGLEFEQVELLRFAGLLHDVGKVGVSEEILLKPSRLSDDEMARVRRHAEIGANIVEQMEFLNGIAPVIMHHHEQWDGGGYPMRLAGEDIPLLARILAVADSFDAMTSESPYRRRLSFADARGELLAGSGTRYDPKVVSAFIEAMDRRALAGATGLLATMGEEPQLPA